VWFQGLSDNAVLLEVSVLRIVGHWVALYLCVCALLCQCFVRAVLWRYSGRAVHSAWSQTAACVVLMLLLEPLVFLQLPLLHGLLH
jgi:hypothetical protein